MRLGWVRRLPSSWRVRAAVCGRADVSRRRFSRILLCEVYSCKEIGKTAHPPTACLAARLLAPTWPAARPPALPERLWDPPRGPPSSEGHSLHNRLSKRKADVTARKFWSYGAELRNFPRGAGELPPSPPCPPPVSHGLPGSMLKLTQALDTGVRTMGTRGGGNRSG